jgi:biotin carboxylase
MFGANLFFFPQIGFPVMIKATAGGGGRGMRLANEESEFVRLLQQAQQVRPGLAAGQLLGLWGN